MFLNRSLFVGAALLACAGSPAMASVISFDSPTGFIATGHNYSGVVAYGFVAFPTTSSAWFSDNLWGKNAGPGEQGLGLFLTTDAEINAPLGSQAVVLNLSALIGQDVKIGIDSLQDDEIAAIGFAASFNPASPNRNAFGSFKSISSSALFDLGVISAANDWIAVEASEGNVLLREISATDVPEPATTAILGTVLLGLGLVKRRDTGPQPD